MRWFGRRWFLAGLMFQATPVMSAGAAARPTGGEQAWRAVEAGGIGFRWRHVAGDLRGRVSAPTAGWMAVGFNDVGQLKGTCFVIAQVSQPPTRLELHRAVVPTHAPVADPVLRTSLVKEGEAFAKGRSHLGFRLPHSSGAALGVALTPGVATYLMLAWSRSPDFQHHSAFREHRWVTL